jgi:hypothetical protein
MEVKVGWQDLQVGKERASCSRLYFRGHYSVLSILSFVSVWIMDGQIEGEQLNRAQ